MGKCEDCGQLKVAGALVLAIVSAAFAVYDGKFADDIKSDPDRDIERRTPGQLASLYQASVAIAVLSVIVFVAMVIGIVVALLGIGLPKVVVIGIFGGGAVVFLGVIIAAGVGAAAATGDVDRAYYLIDSRNYDDNSDVKEYADAYLSHSGSGSASLLSDNRSLRADTSDEKACVNRVGFEFSPSWRYVHTYLPLNHSLLFSSGDDDTYVPYPPDIDVSSSYVNGQGQIETVRLYEETSAKVCYGIEWGEATKKSAYETGKMCDLTPLSVGGCAPGWSIDDVTDLMCRTWKKCVKDSNREKRLEDLEDVGAVRQEYRNEYGWLWPNAWVLPAGWDQVGDLKDWAKSQDAKATSDYFSGTGYVYGPINIVLLVIGAVGWVFLVIGLVLGLLCGGDSNE
jgi:hypothetical protein